MTTLAAADMKMPSIVGDIFSDAYATLIASIDYIEINCLLFLCSFTFEIACLFPVSFQLKQDAKNPKEPQR